MAIILWRALVYSVQKETQKNVLHRAHLHLLFLKHIAGEKPKNLPMRIFVFGISASTEGAFRYFKCIKPALRCAFIF